MGQGKTALSALYVLQFGIMEDRCSACLGPLQPFGSGEGLHRALAVLLSDTLILTADAILNLPLRCGTRAEKYELQGELMK